MGKEKKEEEIKEEKKDKEVIDAEETENIEQETQISKEEIKRQNEILKHLFIWLGVFVFIVIIFFVGINSIRHFKYKGLEFSTEKYGNLILYRTSIPVEYKDSITGRVISNADYNFWLRNDPRKLEKNVPILNGNIEFKKNIVLDLTTKELFCGGDWNIGLHNAVNLLQILGFNVLVKNETAKYEPINEFMFITIQIGNSTNIERKSATMDLGETGEIEIKDENSYYLNINNCEVLPAFERLMLEAFVKYAEDTN